jgi:hypothetical protein
MLLALLLGCRHDDCSPTRFERLVGGQVGRGRPLQVRQVRFTEWTCSAGAPGLAGSKCVRSASAPDVRSVFGQPPYKPEYKELANRYMAYELGELKEEPPGAKAFKTCGQFRFTGLFNADAEGAIEFLSTPGRITITDEVGQLRRIYMDRKLPAELDETYAGTSVGHWEGQTLVIETAGINRHNQFFVLGGGIPIGAGAHSVERLT